MAGGIDWFRWHHGSVTDPKFGLIAKKAGVRVSDVIAVWAYVLESASANSERGYIGQTDVEAIDFLLGFDDGAAQRILQAMQQRGLLDADGKVCAWEKRQPKREDDTAAERKRRQRELQKQAEVAPCVTTETSQPVTQCHAESQPVTQCHDREEKSREEESRGEKRKPSLNEEQLTSGDLVCAAQAAPRPKKATRLPDDWRLPKAWGEWALTEFASWTPEIVRLEAEKFADHWRSKPGKDATKLDWLGTWRNWCRSDIAQRSHGPPRPQRRGKGAHMSDDERSAMGRTENEKGKRLLFGQPIFAEVIEAEVLEINHDRKRL